MGKDDVFVGGFHTAYDGKSEVSLAFVIKHNVAHAASVGYKYLDNVCKILLNDNQYLGVPFMGKVTKNKYVISILFPKQDNTQDDDPEYLMRSLLAMSNLSNVTLRMEPIAENAVKRIDSQFWEKIKKVLQAMASYSGHASEWEDYKNYVKQEFSLQFVVGPQMTAADAEIFYDACLEYAERNQIPLNIQAVVLKDVENYLQKCRNDKKCCVCGQPVFDNTVYPVCQDHYEEYLELGKVGFEHKHRF